MRKRLLGALLLGASALAAPAPARAFCGFYVSGADAKLFNNATLVVLMRDGVRTVLSMQNNYQGPPSDFAMVVPVPVVLSKENVKTLPREIFDRVDKLAAPRLVEYWEQDPCDLGMLKREMVPGAVELSAVEEDEDRSAKQLGVKIEARFSIGEYDVLILSAEDSLGLDTFLRQQRYKIPAGAEPYLRPYVQSGSKFFVAKVDVSKVRFDKGQAMLSPLRFHYDSETFNLPVRLGLINSAGTQDLIVHVIARSRYEVANYENWAIPTNIKVADSVKDNFGAFYAALFDKVLAEHPKAVITEYSWSAGSCDPCPEPPLSPSDLATLGADALPAMQGASEVPPGFASNFTLTRLHVRYRKDALGEDLVFRAAPGITGGTGVPGPDGAMTRGAQPSGYEGSNFQGRYVIMHPWTGPVQCENPQRGIWGGPTAQVAGGPLQVATNTAFAPRGGAPLSSFLAEPVEGLSNDGQKLPSGPVKETPFPEIPRRGGCAACAVEGGPAGRTAGALAALAGIFALWLRRGRRPH
jgi:MYXO-CTERM domain-containing protein